MSLGLSLHLDRGDFVLRFEAVLPGRGVTSLFGPSGSGKTSVLRCVAGLEPTARGRVVVGDEVWLDRGAGIDLPPPARGVGYVFQEAALFPHLTGRQNLEYGWTRTPEEARQVPLDEAVALLGVEPLLDRYPGSLSGGERQRVAMARALVAGPSLLLLDEPLASLDRRSRRSILPYLERLVAHLEIPVLHVSHDADEVRRLAEHVVLLEDGSVRDQGTLAALDEALDESDLDEAPELR